MNKPFMILVLLCLSLVIGGVTYYLADDVYYIVGEKDGESGYVVAEAPKGQENNWIQTVLGKGWSAIFRLYGPLEPWYDKTWRPGEIELVE